MTLLLKRTSSWSKVFGNGSAMKRQVALWGRLSDLFILMLVWRLTSVSSIRGVMLLKELGLCWGGRVLARTCIYDMDLKP